MRVRVGHGPDDWHDFGPARDEWTGFVPPDGLEHRLAEQLRAAKERHARTDKCRAKVAARMRRYRERRAVLRSVTDSALEA